MTTPLAEVHVQLLESKLTTQASMTGGFGRSSGPIRRHMPPHSVMTIPVRKLTLILLSVLLGIPLFVACDPATPITFENRMGMPIIADYQGVTLYYSGAATSVIGRVKNPLVIQPGATQQLSTSIHPKREYGAREKYIMYAENEVGEIVYQRTFTWDELNDLGWKVVIEPGFGP